MLSKSFYLHLAGLQMKKNVLARLTATKLTYSQVTDQDCSLIFLGKEALVWLLEVKCVKTKQAAYYVPRVIDNQQCFPSQVISRLSESPKSGKSSEF